MTIRRYIGRTAAPTVVALLVGVWTALPASAAATQTYSVAANGGTATCSATPLPTAYAAVLQNATCYKVLAMLKYFDTGTMLTTQVYSTWAAGTATATAPSNTVSYRAGQAAIVVMGAAKTSSLVEM